MDLMNMVMAATKNNAIDKLAQQHQLSSDQTSDILGQLLPELAQRVKGNVQQGEGLQSLLSALSTGQHQRFLDQDDALNDPNTLAEGNKILGHLLGNKDNSRQLAAQVANRTGISVDIIKQLLPMAATLLMGTMSKGAQSPDLLGSLLGGSDNQGDMLSNVMGSILGGDNATATSNDAVGSLLKGFLK